MRSIFVLLILVMIGLNGKGQSVTALPDSVLSQCCLEVTLLNGNVTTVDWVFIQYITRDGTGTKLFVEYAPNFGGIQWETQIRIQDDFDDVLERSKFIILPFTVGSTDYGIHRNWIANIEENTTTGGTWIYGRFGTPTKRKFSAVEDYETMKNLLLACRPRAIVVAENGLYTEGDTVRMGGFLIEQTKIRTAGYNWQMKDDVSSAEFGLDYNSPFGDTSVYTARRTGKWRLLNTMGRRYWGVFMEDTTGVSGIYNRITHGFYSGTDDPYVDIYSSSGVGSNIALNWFINSSYGGSWTYKDGASNPYYTHGFSTTQFGAVMGSGESGTGDPGNGVQITTNGYGIGADEWIGIRTKNVDNGLAHPGQVLSLVDSISGKVEFITIDLSAYLPIADTAAMLDPYIQGAGTINRVPIFTGSRVIGNSNIQDNGTAVSILSSKPFMLGQWTTAGRPSGVNGYAGFNTSFNWPEWYSSTGWFSPLQSSLTGGLGTATRVIYTDANGRATDSGNLLFTGTRFQTAGSIRFGRSSHTDTAQIEKVSDVNSKIVRINNPGDVGGWNSGLVFRGGANGVLATVGTFRIYTSSSTIPGSTYFGNIPEGNAQSANSSTNVGVINKLTSAGTYDIGINVNPGNSSLNPNQYRLTTAKQFGIHIGGSAAQTVEAFSAVNYGVFVGYQYQPLANGYGSSMVLSTKDDAGSPLEILRLQGKDGNICIGCTNAQYKLYTTSTDAYGLPRGTVGQRPAIITSTTPLRFNTDSTALEYGESVGTWRQISTRAYARSLVAGLGAGTVTSVGLSLPSIFSVSGSPVTTSGTLSATFTGGTASQFLRGDGRWMKSLYFNSSDSIQFNSTDPYFGSTALMSVKGSSGSFDSRFNIADYGYVNQALAIATGDDARYIFDRSRGTIASPTALLKDDRIGGIYFNAHNGTSYRKTGYIGAVVDSIYSGANPQSKLIFGTSEVNSPETSSYWRFLIESMRNISVVDHVTGASMGVGFGSNITTLEASTIDARFHIKGVGTTTGKTMLLEDSGGADILTITDDKTIQAHGYGTGTKEAADLSKTQSNYIAGFATDGTALDLEQKRDTTIYIEDADYDFSAALTTTQISRRYNRIIFWMTTTAAAGSDSEITLHTPDANLMQVEYLIHSVDEAGGFDNRIIFGTNNAVDSTNGLVTNYYPSAGQGVHIRAGLRSGVYKYRYNN